ncbi:hypothetical protein OIU77_027455 [Salix suchowensis]|uniref:Uncharacterized protein n=1 Tax=Salix suchowensis TaxID=1278906 RepID=A0ABQ9BSX5_9ROSI|nr:hypothetical protein OIU77_027455 [Salix suchowensis]
MVPTPPSPSITSTLPKTWPSNLSTRIPSSSPRYTLHTAVAGAPTKVSSDNSPFILLSLFSSNFPRLFSLKLRAILSRTGLNAVQFIVVASLYLPMILPYC